MKIRIHTPTFARLLFAATGLALVAAASAVTQTFTSSTTWVCPSGVTSVQVECWGGGGAGGGASRNGQASGSARGGGGAGGAYAKLNAYPVTAGNTYYINVGTGGVSVMTDTTRVAGGDSWFNSVNSPSTTILAKGGAGGETVLMQNSTSRAGGGGVGTATGSIGDVVNAGGSGGTSSSANFGGSGGGSGGAGAVSGGNPGVSGDGTTGVGAVAVSGGGNGGNANATSNSSGPGQSPTTPPGGGGGGARCANTSTTLTGGTGAAGQVVLTYSPSASYIYKSKVGAGDWTSTTIWQRNDGAGGNSFSDTTTPPDASATNITIVSGSTVTVSSPQTAVQLTVDNGGTLTVSGAILTVNHTAGSTKDLSIHGTLNLSYASPNALTLGAGALMTLESDGVLNHTGNANAITGGGTRTFDGTYKQNIHLGVIPTANWSLNSTCQIDTTFTADPAAAVLGYGQTFGNFIWNAQQSGAPIPFAVWVKLAGGNAVTSLTVAGTLTIQSTGGSPLQLNTRNASSQTLTAVNVGAFVMTGGAFVAANSSSFPVTMTVTNGFSVSGGSFSASANSAINVGGDVALTGSGTVTGSAAFNFAKAGAQALTVTTSGALTSPAWNVNPGATVTLGGASAFTNATLSVAGAFINNGNLSVGTSLSGAGALTQGANATLTLGGSTTAIATLDATSNLPNTVNYNRAGNQTVLAVNYHHLSLLNTNTKTLGGNMTVNGTATVAPDVTLNFSSNVLTTASAPSLSGTLLMPVTKTAPNTFTGSKLVQTAATLGFGGALSLTVSGLSPASGEVVDLFDAPGFSGSFSSISLSPGGAGHWDTSQLAVNGSVQFVNNLPTAPALDLGVASGASITVQVIGGKITPTDADAGDVLTISSVTAPANGVASTDGTNITYTANAGFTGADNFSYVVSDGYGTATGSVAVTVTAATGYNQLALEPLGGGAVRLSYLGIPGTNYALDWRTNLTLGGWVPVATNPAGPAGSLVFTNTSSEPANFYRTRYVP